MILNIFNEKSYHQDGLICSDPFKPVVYVQLTSNYNF